MERWFMPLLVILVFAWLGILCAGLYFGFQALHTAMNDPQVSEWVRTILGLAFAALVILGLASTLRGKR